MKIFKAKNEIKTIGVRHGEKLFETLLTREEFAHAIDLGNFYKIPADSRDLNYDRYFEKGEYSVIETDEYNSNNTNILNIEEIESTLLKQQYVLSELKDWKT